MKNYAHIFPVSRPEEKSGYLLYQVNMLWERRINQSLKEIDLTHTQFKVLISTAWLGKEGISVALTEISKFMLIDRMMTSRITEKLAQRGLMTKLKSATSARSKEVQMTEEGIELLKQAIERMKTLEKDFFHVLGDGHDVLREQLEELLLKHRDL